MKFEELPLAVFAPTIGARSQTFVKKHTNELLPGQTLTVSRKNKHDDWDVSGQFFNLELEVRYSPYQSLKNRFYRSINYQPEIAALKSALKKHRVRVIMSEFLDWSVQWIDLANDLGITFFAHAHGTDINSRLREEKWRREYLRYNNTGGIITISEYSKKQLIDIGIRPDKIFVVPCGTDSQPNFSPKANTDKIKCLNVGRMIACKSPILALDSFRRAAEKNNKLHFNYVGAGPYFQAAQQFVTALQLQDIVHLKGGVPHSDVKQLLTESDIYIQHSVLDPETGQAEGLPVSILEAMSYGLPVVATKLTGIPEAVEDEVTGFLVEPGDSAGMAEKILLLAANVDLRNTMGEAGWRRVNEKFSWQHEKAELLRIFAMS